MAGQDVAGQAMMAQVEKYLGFRLGSEEFGLELLKVREIIGLQKITRVPRAPDFVRGVINLRGKIIPVIDLRSKLGMESTELSERTCIIVVDVLREGSTIQMGILVDSVSEVLSVPAADVEPPPPLGDDFDKRYLRGMAKLKGTVKILLSIQDVLSSADVLSVADVAAAA